MVDLAMMIFVFHTKFLIFWHPWYPLVCIRSDLKPLFETDSCDSSYCDLHHVQIGNQNIQKMAKRTNSGYFLKKVVKVKIPEDFMQATEHKLRTHCKSP